MTLPYDLLAGIDWATQSHRVCLVTPDGTVAGERTVKHEAPAIHAWLDALLARAGGQADRVAVAIEVPRGALVETLLERGFHVYALNPKQADRFRDRHTVAGAKDDRRDAYVLADALRTDLHKFRRVAPDHPLVIQIREISRADEDLREEANRLSNRFREQVHRSAPQLLGLCPSADEPWFWELAEHATLPGARPMSRARVAKLLARHRIRRLDADQVRSALLAERLYAAPGAAEAASAHIRLLLPRLRMVREQRTGCQKQLDQLLSRFQAEEEEHGDGPGDAAILRSLPRCGKPEPRDAVRRSRPAARGAQRSRHAGPSRASHP